MFSGVVQWCARRCAVGLMRRSQSGVMLASSHDRDGRFSSAAPPEKGRGMTSRRTLHLPALLLLVAALAAAVVFVVVLGIAPTKADAAASSARTLPRPPEAVLMKAGKELQKGRLGTYCWSTEDQGVCSDTFSDYTAPPNTPRVGTPNTLRIRIHYADRPERIWLRWGHEIKKGRGIGIRIVEQSKPRPIRLERVQKGGETVAWDVFFKVKRPGKHYYINFWAFWDEEEGGDSQWSFHVKTRRAS